MSEIIRNSPNRQQNTILPNKSQTAYELDKNPTPGLISLNEAIKLTTQKTFSKEVDNGIVIDLVSPKNSLKTKYNLPHLNFKKDKDGKIVTIEGYLLKIRSPDVDKDALTKSPEDILLEAMNLDKGSSAAFNKIDKSNPKSVEAWLKYCSYSSMHGTFAPICQDGFFSLPPLPGSTVRLKYFQEPHISAGHTIVGVYEKMYDDEKFETGFKEISNFLEKFRQKYIQSALESIVQAFTSNVPAVQTFNATSTATQVAGQISGQFGNVSDSNWPPVDVIAEYIGSPQSPSVETYNIVIDQFNVETNPRYLSRRIPNYDKVATFCNIFVADVTWAMGTPVPWQVDENGNPQPMTAKFKRGWTQLGAKGMFDWLKTHGARYGWKEVTAQEAQDNANKGLTTVATTERHIAMIRPGTAGTDKFGVDPRTAQAGFPAPRSGFNNILLSKAGPGFRAAKYYTCFSNNRYVSPTQEQLQRLSTTVAEETTSEVSSEQQQENPQENSYEENLQTEEQTSIEQ